MTVQDRATLIAAICRIPADFRRRGDVSRSEILAESGYFADPDALEVATLAAHLADHPELVHDWLVYSEDKRTSKGWYFGQRPSGAFEIGQLAGGSETFTDPCMACAAFILREIRGWGRPSDRSARTGR